MRDQAVTGLEHSGYGPDWVYHEIFDGDPYRLEGRDPKVVLDVGANYGFFSVRCAQLWPDVVIRAFEPDLENLKWCLENLSRSGTVVDLRAQAVAGHSGTVDFIGGLDVHSHIAFSAYDTLEPTPVPCLTLTEATEGLDRIDFAKFDIEGGEYAIVTETPPETWARIDSVAMEVHWPESCDVPALTARLGEFYDIDIDGSMIFGTLL